MNGTPESQKSESAPSANRPTSTKRERLTQERARDLFDYRGSDGQLIWKIAPNNRVMVGAPLNNKDKNGYLRVGICGKSHFAHRIVWLWHYGYLPENYIDHLNRDKTDNRIENLREVSNSCNQRNTGTPKDNTSGVKGVCKNATGKKWLAQISDTGRRIYLGVFENFLEAVCHRLAAEQALGWAGCDDCSPAFQYVNKHITQLRG